ncbi:MAG TPA: serine hydrolase [Isosphaeraceae bacterium]|jgi:CubicO group peptidase (beta-lactamase class C family)|nr:serine hydrolase [Isosphaeraceae bacterium]
MPMKARRLIKRILIGVGALFVVLIVALGGLIAWQWTFINRIRHFPANPVTDVAWYTPKERVPGGDGTPLPRARPEEIRIAPEALKAVAKLADAKNASALLVLHDDQVVLEEHWRGHRPGDPTNSMSMAKTIVSLLIGIALEEGKIKSLDEPAATWLPAWRDDARRKITLRHLLQMHSGLQAEGTDDDPLSDRVYLILGTNMRFVVDYIPAVAEPGTQFDYNNVNFQALGFILEAATGKRYSEYLSEKLWKPIGAGEAAVWLDRENGSAHTGGFLFAKPEDWAKVGLLLLHDGQWNGRQIISHEYLRQMITPSPTEPRYGQGIWLAHNPYQAQQEDEQQFLANGIFYLDGHSKQRVYVVPSQRLIVVRVGENGRRWDEAALCNTVLRGLLPRVKDEPAN